MAMIGRGRAHRGEERTALAMAGEIALPRKTVLTGQRGKAGKIGAETFELRIDYRIGPVGGDHSPAPATVADRPVVIERIERAFSCCEQFDPVALEQRAGAKGLGCQSLSDGVEVEVSRIRFQSNDEA